MTKYPEGKDGAPRASTANGKESGTSARHEARDDLQMAPERMLDLARKAAELVVERIEGLPAERAWDGDFQQELERQLLEDPPEDGRSAEEVMERAARDILPFAARIDHPRCFGFIPSSPTWPRGWRWIRSLDDNVG